MTSSDPPAELISRWDPDFDLLNAERARLNGRLRIGDSTPRRNESAITTLKPPESGESSGPGIMRDIECRTGVYGRSGSGILGSCCWFGCVCTLPCVEDLGVGGFGLSVDSRPSEGSTGEEVVACIPGCRAA